MKKSIGAYIRFSFQKKIKHVPNAKFVLTLINVLVLINVLPGIFPKFNKRPDLNKNVLDGKMAKLNKNVLPHYSEV